MFEIYAISMPYKCNDARVTRRNAERFLRFYIQTCSLEGLASFTELEVIVSIWLRII